MINPVAYTNMFQNMPNFYELPNGAIVPPVQKSSQGTAMRSITDGTSKTILLAESKEQTYSSWYDGTLAWQVAMPANNLAVTSIANQTYQMYMPIQPFRTTAIGATSSVPTYFWKVLPTAVSGLNYGPTTDPYKVYLQNSTVLNPAIKSWKWGPSSDHSGGVVLHAWCDAHVSTIQQDVDPTLYIQLVTRAGHEPAADPGQE